MNHTQTTHNQTTLRATQLPNHTHPNTLTCQTKQTHSPRVGKRRKSSHLYFSSAAIGGRLPRFFCPQNVMVSTSSCFRLPIGSRHQKFFWRLNVLETAANREAEATGDRLQKITWRHDNLETSQLAVAAKTWKR